MAIGGGAGTLSELALAWLLKRHICVFSSVSGKSAAFAGQRIDSRGAADRVVYGVENEAQVVHFLVQQGIIKQWRLDF